MQITRNTTPYIFVDEMLKSELADRCHKRGFVGGDDTEQFIETAMQDTELSTEEINVAFRDFERAIKGLKKQYVLIDLSCYNQEIIAPEKLSEMIAGCSELEGLIKGWICEEYIVIEVAAE